AFLNAHVDGRTLASWLSDSSGAVANYDFKFLKYAETVRWERRSSHTRHVLGLKTPYSSYTIEPADRTSTTPFIRRAPLVKDEFPSFYDYETALYHLLYDLEHEPGWMMPEYTTFVRVAHREAWIEQVVVSPRSLVVTIEGSRVADTRLAISGSEKL